MTKDTTVHSLRVYGEKKAMVGNVTYYSTINDSARRLTALMNEPHTFFSKLLDVNSGDQICEIQATSDAYVQKLARILRNTGFYREVTVSSENVGLEKTALEGGAFRDLRH